MSYNQEMPDPLEEDDVWRARRGRHIWLAGLVASGFLGALTAFGETRMDGGLSEAFLVALDPSGAAFESTR